MTIEQHEVNSESGDLSPELTDLKNKPNTGDLLRKNIGIVLAEIDKVHQILLVNDQSITAKLDSMRKRRDAQGFISKNTGRVRNLKDKAADVYVPLVGRGVKAARSAKHFILTKGVRKVVPKPVRKAVTWFGDAMQDTQDFWRELAD